MHSMTETTFLLFLPLLGCTMGSALLCIYCHFHEWVSRIPRPKRQNHAALRPPMSPNGDPRRAHVITITNHLGLVPPGPRALLFLRLGFGTPPPGVLGLLSLLLPFLGGGISVTSFAIGEAPGLAVATVGVLLGNGITGLSLSLPVVLRWKSPGCPVMGFSSIYSLPYLSVMLRVSSRSRPSM